LEEIKYLGKTDPSVEFTKLGKNEIVAHVTGGPVVRKF